MERYTHIQKNFLCLGRRHRGVITAVALASSLAAAPAYAADLSMPGPMTMDMSGQGASMDMNGQSMDGMDHAAIPAGVYGAGMVGAGHFMFSYTPSYMRMEDNYIGSSIVSPDTIATTVKLPMPMMMMGMTFDTYRIVPTSMDMQMHMFHAMYGVTDWLNIMVMGAYDLKSMTMLTYKGAMGDTALGSTTNRTSGFGDTSVMSLWRVYKDPINEVHINVGLSLPTGSTTETMNMLMPMGTYMTMRANYGMQLGTGTVDLLPGVTYLGHIAQWSWGAIYRGRLALGDNTEGYEYGYRQEISGWAGYRWIPGVTSTFRVQGEVDDRIHGADPQIMGLMQGSNPYFYGGQRINLLGGLEVSGAPFGLQHVSLAIEGGAPVYQNLNGPQLGEAWQLTGALHVGF
ncbi:hypothetical protein DES32_1032 [Methylovirgula ligni]|uniref:Outer membrane beta-barrel porin/alpha-amylase n=1 Tax=Methylovirgula ligni TaxID=569860 RepID=A0A3D9YXP0_9HYPH|nr:alpha-amylase [Methylovirgula ligni]REF87411.1 hypothetical protein DES32_1032 [Methylovirgula ligni]